MFRWMTIAAMLVVVFAQFIRYENAKLDWENERHAWKQCLMAVAKDLAKEKGAAIYVTTPGRHYQANPDGTFEFIEPAPKGRSK